MYLLELAGDDDAFAVREAASRCSDVELLAPGLATARGVRRPETLAYTRRVCRLVGTCDPAVEDAVTLLKAADFEAVRGSVAVRARDVRGRTGVDTQAAEGRLGSVLVDRGLAVDLEDPDHTLVALFSETAALGWLAAESRRDFGTRQPTDKPFFQPGSMDPMDARALANVAGAGPDARLLDPMCGTGGILVEAGLAGAEVVGVDAQRKMVEGARENLGHYLEDGFDVARGDATRLPFADRSFDAAVFDAPYGRQSKIEGVSLEDLVGDALSEVRRVAGRAVLVGDRPWNDAAAAAGWDVESRFDRRVHRSLTRYVHVLE
ncbi:methyltransferase domain-containing protein [Natronomonas salina]|uniref:methyltransferase domain-containing protein n=1 Tax=Natronomonas salina TaxID=1710540 RepID=UPI0015B5B72A|nr:methyltransferase domain-containing protein [Natronomonas salina]QLD89672.1 methyltransferase domain-containing protein [Natronomonas salina]